MSIGLGRWKVIVDKEAAEYCLKYRTIREAHFNYLQAHPEAINKRGKPITYQALHVAAWRWILRNLAESRKVLTDVYAANGQVLDDETWKILIASHARASLKSPRVYEKFIVDNGLEAYRTSKQPRTADLLSQ